MLTATAIALIVALVLVLVRASAGPTTFDRILAVNLFGCMAVLLISVYTFISGRKEILDIALTYVLVNFVGIIALLRFFSFGSGSDSEES